MENKELDNVMDIIRQEKDREMVENIKVVLDMLRHLHDDIEYVKRNVAVLDHKINGLAHLVSTTSPMILNEALIENVLNPNTKTIDLDKLYSPIDEEDRREQEKIKREHKEMGGKVGKIIKGFNLGK